MTSSSLAHAKLDGSISKPSPFFEEFRDHGGKLTKVRLSEDLLTALHDRRDRCLSVVPIVGVRRAGKSTLLDFVIGYMHQKNMLTNCIDPNNLFQARDTQNHNSSANTAHFVCLDLKNPENNSKTDAKESVIFMEILIQEDMPLIRSESQQACARHAMASFLLAVVTQLTSTMLFMTREIRGHCYEELSRLVKNVEKMHDYNHMYLPALYVVLNPTWMAVDQDDFKQIVGCKFREYDFHGLRHANVRLDLLPYEHVVGTSFGQDMVWMLENGRLLDKLRAGFVDQRTGVRHTGERLLLRVCVVMCTCVHVYAFFVHSVCVCMNYHLYYNEYKWICGSAYGSETHW